MRLRAAMALMGLAVVAAACGPGDLDLNAFATDFTESDDPAVRASGETVQGAAATLDAEVALEEAFTETDLSAAAEARKASPNDPRYTIQESIMTSDLTIDHICGPSADGQGPCTPTVSQHMRALDERTLDLVRRQHPDWTYHEARRHVMEEKLGALRTAINDYPDSPLVLEWADRYCAGLTEHKSVFGEATHAGFTLDEETSPKAPPNC